MGRAKRKDKAEVHKGIDGNRDLLDQVKAQNGIDVAEIFDMVTGNTDMDAVGVDHIPLHSLKEIKEKLGKKEVVAQEDGPDILQPIYNEEQKVQVIFGLLSEKGINLLDFLENVLAETGYNGKVLFSINETMGKVTELLRDISDMQYKKAKLENERTHLEIMKYKADLKKREIDIKEKAVDKNLGSSGTQVIAVGNPAELLAIMQGKKGVEDIAQADVVEEEE